MKKKSTALWGGRFSQAPASLLQKFGESVSFDWRLYKQDIAGSIAHATMLKSVGILTGRELAQIKRGLKKIQAQIEAGKFAWSTEREDVHMNIEAELTRRAPVGAKLHTGRSRNDQVATDMRLWLREEIQKNQWAITQLQQALVKLGRKYESVVIPGYTHVQRAQPVYFAHHLLAYVEMLERDNGRFEDCVNRLNVSPLGSGAIAGSTLPLKREMTAKLLGFNGVTQNSMDAVSDRDFIVEYNAAAALTAVHLSRLAEDLILWSSAEFNFVRIGDAYTTGSSLMPQKKNPDVAELTRGKSARVVGNLVSLLVLLKGLPMTYNRDLQEDKERMFDTAETIQNTLEITAAMLGTVKVNAGVCECTASDPLLLATDLADWLVKKGMPFRKAHHVVGSVVALAEQKKKRIHELNMPELKSVSPLFDSTALRVFDVRRAMAARKMIGAPNPVLIHEQLVKWEKLLKRR